MRQFFLILDKIDFLHRLLRSNINNLKFINKYKVYDIQVKKNRLIRTKKIYAYVKTLVIRKCNL